MKMDQFYFTNWQKLPNRNDHSLIHDSVIQQLQQQKLKRQNHFIYNNNIKAGSQSILKSNNNNQYGEKYIGTYHVISSIQHVDSYVNSQKKVQQFTDYLCIKQHLTSKGIRRTQLSPEGIEQQQATKKKLYLLCKSSPKDKQQLSLDFFELEKLFQSILLAESHFKGFPNLIFPSADNQLQSSPGSYMPFYVPFSMNNVLSSVNNNIEEFRPLRNFTFSQKFQSQLFCLNLFYRFLLSILKPLLKIIKVVHEKYGHLELTIVRFIEDCLIIENVFYQEQTNQFFLFCNCQRYYVGHKEKTKNQQKISLNKDAIQKRYLVKASSIFWTLFFSESTQKHNKKHVFYVHNSFMTNFLSSITNGELSFQQTVEILQSKQKRKAFISSKLQIPQLKQANNFQLFNGGGKKRILSYKARASETVDINNHKLINSLDTFDVNDASLSNNVQTQKQKSVKRKLKQKRNTIDVMFQNYLSNKDVPPSFLNRSLDKKGKLFRHQKSVSKSKSRDRSLQSYFESIKKDTSQYNCSLNYSSSKKKVVSSRGQNNLLFDKSFNRQVSKTIEIAEITQQKDLLMNSKPITKVNQTIGFQSQSHLQTQNNSTQKLKSFSFVKTNSKSSKLYLKSSTQKISINQQIGAITQTPQHLTFLNSKQNIFIKTDNMNKFNHPSKKINRRYYYHPNSIINPGMSNNNESIQRLIEEQWKIHRAATERSKEKHLLNKNQQTALANFNRQFSKNSYSNNQNQEEKSLSQSKLKQFNVKITRNPSNITKNFHQIQKNRSSQQVQQIENINIKNDLNSQFNNSLKTNQQSSTFKNSREFLATFSPPKNSNSKRVSKTQALRVQFSSNAMVDKLRSTSSVYKKIDDSQLKAKLSSYFTTDVKGILQNNTIIEESHIRSVKQQVLQNYQIPNITDRISRVNQQSHILNNTQLQTSYNLTNNKVNYQINQIDNYNLTFDPNKKVSNEYFIVEGQSQQQVSKPITKLNNQKLNVDEIFVEQQQFQFQKDKQQLKTALNDQKVTEQKVFERDSFQDNDVDEISQIEMTGKLSKLENMNMISPIKFAQMENSQVEIMRNMKGYFDANLIGKLQNNDDFLGQNDLKQKNHSHGINDKLVQDNKIADQSPNFQQIPQPIIPKPQQQKLIIQQLQLQQQLNLKSSFNCMTHQEINQSIQQAQIIQREPIIYKNRKPSIQLYEKKQNEEEKIYRVQKKQQRQLSQQQIKQVKKESTKKTIKLAAEDEDNELEEIKLTPVVDLTKVTEKSVNRTTQKQPISETHPQQLKQTSQKDLINNSQPPLPSKASQQPYQSSKNNQQLSNDNKRSKQQLSRKNSAKSSQASSYGPHKTVKKIVEQYVFFVNRIGEAIAKSAAVSKKVQKVCQWFVGVYFLYKRFFYERKKIEKYLREGIPKLTRYEQQLNPDEWALYLKSADRQELLKKVTEENLKVTLSIQKMQGKLMGRKVPDQIKRFSKISTRSNQQSLIAIEAVIDEFDQLTDNNMLKDEQILCHCTSLLNACLVLAELDNLTEDILPIGDLITLKRTPQELEVIAQNLFDLYHVEESPAEQNSKKN